MKLNLFNSNLILTLILVNLLIHPIFTDYLSTNIFVALIVLISSMITFLTLLSMKNLIFNTNE